ncbi:MAG: GFA family protein [Pseudomonadales bacterium]
MPSKSSDPVRTGGCQCTAVRFEAHGEPKWTAYCHCRDCQRQTAAPVSLYTGFVRDQVRFVRGQPAARASSAGVERGFCRDCGTPLYYAAPERFPGEIHLFVATFDAPAGFAPQSHVYFEERLPGFDVRDDLPRR